MIDSWKAISLQLAKWAVFFLPEEKQIAIERRFRGREEYRRMQQSDWLLVSYGKSGRTWLRLMLTRFFQSKHDITSKYMVGFERFHHQYPIVPSVFFTHGNYLRDYTNHWDTKADFYDSTVLLLVRDPRDVAVSQYFQWKFRMKPGKKRLNKYPSHGSDISLFEFVMDKDAGLPSLIAWFNLWAQEIHHVRKSLIIRYEDMRVSPNKSLKQILEFLGTPGTDAEIKDAVDFAAFDNMKNLESKKAFSLSGKSLVPGDSQNPNSYKVRRAKVGGYRDYFSDLEIEEIENLLQSTLSPMFGYCYAVGKGEDMSIQTEKN